MELYYLVFGRKLNFVSHYAVAGNNFIAKLRKIRNLLDISCHFYYMSNRRRHGVDKG